MPGYCFLFCPSSSRSSSLSSFFSLFSPFLLPLPAPLDVLRQGLTLCSGFEFTMFLPQPPMLPSARIVTGLCYHTSAGVFFPVCVCVCWDGVYYVSTHKDTVVTLISHPPCLLIIQRNLPVFQNLLDFQGPTTTPRYLFLFFNMGAAYKANTLLTDPFLTPNAF